jgi:excisionase family DNA binding protein
MRKRKHEISKDRATYSVLELADTLGLCERTTRIALREGRIPSFKLGKRYIVSRSAVAKWLEDATGRPDVA